VQKYGTAKQATEDNTARAHCMPDKYGKNADIFKYSILTAFPPKQSLGERALMLRFMYTACLA